jgi:hypothetical protein
MDAPGAPSIESGMNPANSRSSRGPRIAHSSHRRTTGRGRPGAHRDRVARPTTSRLAEAMRAIHEEPRWPSEREMLSHLERDWSRIDAARELGVAAERPCGGHAPVQQGPTPE